jgi:hypothetical protein
MKPKQMTPAPQDVQSDLMRALDAWGVQPRRQIRIAHFSVSTAG